MGSAQHERPLSCNQLFQLASHCSEEELDSVLREGLASFASLGDPFLVVLIRKHGFGLREAFERLDGLGFEMGRRSIDAFSSHYSNQKALPPASALQLADFELVLGYWSALEQATREWLGFRFLSYWESPLRPALSGEMLWRFKPMWEALRPSIAQKLSPDRACSLGWGAVETHGLLDTHVETNGDALLLAKELNQHGFLTADVINRHQGFITALLQFDPQLLVEKVLSGEVVMTDPRPSTLLSLLNCLARVLEEPAWAQLTTQHTKHLVKVMELLAGAEMASNMMYQGLTAVMRLLAKLERKDRQPLLRRVSGYCLVDRCSRVAEVPNPERGATHYGDATRPAVVFEAFVEKALDFMSLQECISLHCAQECVLSEAVRSKFHRWALAQLDLEQSSEQVLELLRTWVFRLCTPLQVLEIWLKMVDVMNSWSFLLNAWSVIPSYPEALKNGADEEQLARSVFEHAVERLQLEPRMRPERRTVVMARLAAFWPQRFVEDHGIREWLRLKKVGVVSERLVPRKAHSKPEELEQAEQINDALLPERELQAVLQQHPVIEKTKTKEEWALVQSWVRSLDACLFSNEELAERMSQIMCAVWGDKAALLSACGSFCSKLLQSLLAGDCTALVKFLRKCPNLGNKRQFLLTQLQACATAPWRPKLVQLHPLLASQATKASDLVDFVQALGYKQISGETETLFFELLEKEEPLERMQLLKRCGFTTSSHLCDGGDCVEADADFWNQLEVAEAVASTEEPTAATRPETVVSMGSGASLYKTFGPRGEALFASFLAAAEPAQLWELLGDSEAFREICRPALPAWKPPVPCPAGQEDAIVQLDRHFPELNASLLPSLLASSVSESSEARVRQLRPRLAALPRAWWHCVHFESASEEDLAKLAAAGVVVPLQRVAFGELRWETQQQLLETPAHWGSLEALVDFVPQAVGNISRYLERVFELLAGSEDLLVRLGDGLERPEQLASGWNKMVHRLLLAVRERVKGNNMLHTSEQLVLFAKCEGRCDNTNSSLLADLMEGKAVDPLHIAPLVNFVLSEKGFNKQVRDSALRAMMRLSSEERDALHKRLLDTDRKLPLQVIFSIAVSVLHQQAVPLVLRQLGLLSLQDWDELLDLIRDANPKQGHVHTFPRSLRSAFNERFLLRYLADKQRDLRFFQLFVACTDRDALSGYLLDVLARQLHALDETFLGALSFSSREEDPQLGLEVKNPPLSPAHFRELLEYIQPTEWSGRLNWALPRVRDSPEAELLLQHALDLLQQQSLKSQAPALLKQMLKWESGELLKREGLRQVLHRRCCELADRSLWVCFFKQSWGAIEPATTREPVRSEVEAALDLEKDPLKSNEVLELGVSVPAMKLLVQLAPEHALRQHGFAILNAEPAFAKQLTEQQFALVTQLRPQDDAQWPLCRKLIAELAPPAALKLAVALLNSSREGRDVALLKGAYHAADRFTRKQTQLKVQLAPVWKQFGARIQREVIDEVSCSDSMSAAVSQFDPDPEPKAETVCPGLKG